MKTLRPITTIIAPLLLLSVLVVSDLSTPVLAATTPGLPAPGSTFDQRLTQRKQEQNVQLDSKTQMHLQQTCNSAQGIIRKLQGTTTSTVANHNAAYTKVDATLWVDIGQLKLANLNTFTLEQQHTTLVQKIATFQAVAVNYQQTLDDTLVINCQADVVGFQALINTNRAYYQQVQAASADVYQYTVNTVLPSLQTFNSQLQSASSSTNGQ